MFVFFQKHPHIRSTDFFFFLLSFTSSSTLVITIYVLRVYTHKQTHTQPILPLGNWLFFQGITDIFKLFFKRSILKPQFFRTSFSSFKDSVALYPLPCYFASSTTFCLSVNFVLISNFKHNSSLLRTVSNSCSAETTFCLLHTDEVL